jgi:hypothetical protein
LGNIEDVSSNIRDVRKMKRYAVQLVVKYLLVCLELLSNQVLSLSAFIQLTDANSDPLRTLYIEYTDDLSE